MCQEKKWVDTQYKHIEILFKSVFNGKGGGGGLLYIYMYVDNELDKTKFTLAFSQGFRILNSLFKQCTVCIDIAFGTSVIMELHVLVLYLIFLKM